MNENVKQAIELEEKMIKAFSDVGWDCLRATSSKQFDITLSKDGREYGYVETYICKNPRMMKNKIERIQSYLEESKPKLFILTDGISFENYFDGEYFSTTTIPVGYFEYSQRNRLMAYYNMFKEMQNGKKGD